jgi:hypothetical protein
MGHPYRSRLLRHDDQIYKTIRCGNTPRYRSSIWQKSTQVTMNKNMVLSCQNTFSKGLTGILVSYEENGAVDYHRLLYSFGVCSAVSPSPTSPPSPLSPPSRGRRRPIIWARMDSTPVTGYWLRRVCCPVTTADLSTPLRSGRDYKFVRRLASVVESRFTPDDCRPLS